jgi:hypothetical protein
VQPGNERALHVVAARACRKCSTRVLWDERDNFVARAQRAEKYESGSNQEAPTSGKHCDRRGQRHGADGLRGSQKRRLGCRHA